MSEPFIGEIQMFGFTFAPRGWAQCDGQLLAIAQNDALFSLLGTTYGGDGRVTFGLPDLRGRVAMHAGSGAGLSMRRIGERAGAETATVSATQLASHTHPLTGKIKASEEEPTSRNPEDRVLAKSASRQVYGDVPSDPADLVDMAANVYGETSNAGGNASHPNMQPFLTVNFCIALVGIYPSRN